MCGDTVMRKHVRGNSIEKDVFDLEVFSRLHCAAKRLGYFLLKYMACPICVCVYPFTYCTVLHCNSSTHVSYSWTGHIYKSVPSQDNNLRCLSATLSPSVIVSQWAEMMSGQCLLILWTDRKLMSNTLER